MNSLVNETHDPSRRSWVEAANDPACDFPIQNLPYGVFRRRGTSEPGRIGVAIGDQILDVKACIEQKALPGLTAEGACSLCAATLNQFMGLGTAHWAAARRAIGDVLDLGSRAKPQAALVPQRDAEMLLPAAIGDYSDFYASIHHATNVGSMFRPDQPLMPNYKHLPVGYHGRASSIVVSGTPIRRPMGQTKADDAAGPSFGPCRLLDYEVEIGCFIGPGNALGTRLTMDVIDQHLFGVVLLNDWSARDIQKWEYQPLGPFNAKNFATTISPWVVTMEALAPHRVDGPPRAADDPPMLEYLQSRTPTGLALTLDLWLKSQQMCDAGQDAAHVSRAGFAGMYWTLAQMAVHHTSSGCNLRPGDLIGSGTVSGPQEESRGCLLERTWRGERPLPLPDGTLRRFLMDGDEVTLVGHAGGDGHPRIGLGRCQGRVEPVKLGNP